MQFASLTGVCPVDPRRRRPQAPSHQESGTSRPVCARLAVLSVALLTTLAPPGRAQDLLTRESAVTLASPGDGPLSAGDLTVLLGGVPQGVVALRPTAGSWRIVLYFDPLLATPEGLRRAADAFSREAALLTRLGQVEVVTADPYPDHLAEPTRSVDAIRDALEIVADEADGAGDFLHLREDFLELRGSDNASPEAAQEAYARELELLQERQESLIGWLSAGDSLGPRLLVLIRDGYDLAGLRFYQGALSSRPAGSDAAAVQQEMTRLLATLGWTVLTPAEGPARHPIEKKRAALKELVQATGGELVSDLDRLGESLERLSQRQQALLRLTGPPDGEPRPLEIRDRRSGAQIPASRWASVATPLEVALARARQILEEPSGVAGRLGVQGALRTGGLRPGSGPPALEVLSDIRGSGLDRSEPLFRVTWLVEPLEGSAVSGHQLVAAPDLTAFDGWIYHAALDLPGETAEVVVVVEELRSGAWGGAILESSRAPLETAGLRIADLGSAATLTPTPALPESSSGTVIRLLPPRKRQLTGKTRFRTLTSHPAVSKVDFYLDGRELGSDTSPPFGWIVDLDSPPRPQTVKVVAYATGDAILGSHSLTVNRIDRSFEVRITRISGDPATGSVEVEAAISVPVDARLTGVEVYRNELLAGRLEAPTWRTRIETPHPTPQDFVRVVAYLEDGSSNEDARLLAADTATLRLDVNLVELNVVVLDRQDKPLSSLAREDFSVLVDGRRRQIERFALAEDVPLVLGLVIDTSESMDALMEDTKKAGAQFLSETVRDGDQAFLVDFDTKPRLVQATTRDVIQLIGGFSSLRADGFTALYDAVVFSLLQFEEAEGRKALVVLTDGRNYRSQFGIRHCVRYGRQLGVPIYIISLDAVQSRAPWSPSSPPPTPLDKPKTAFRRTDLEAIGSATGGRVFYISAMVQLSEAYARINEELRSQYVLAFPTERRLSLEELDEIHVQVSGRGLKVRTVVGSQRID